MELSHEDCGSTRLVRVEVARIDAASAIQFKDMMRELCGTEFARIVLDVSLVDFLDSSGLGAVVAALKAMPAGTSLELAGLTPNVRKVFHLTRMDTVFTLHKDATTALEGREHAS